MMFKKFAQVDSSDSKAKGGTGLGLSISKAIVEKFGGKIDYESVLNSGSTFYIDLPAQLATEEPEPDSTPINPDRPKILIVEDDADIAALLKMILEDAGYSAAVARNATEALQQAESGEFAAMTLDLMLPDKQGITLVQELRNDTRTAYLPIIVVSAVADQQKQQFHGGFDILDWIQKPIDLPRLRRVLQQSVYQTGEGKYNILHVEDDPDNIEIVAQILADRATIVAATTLQAAQKKVLQNRFDLVILDVTLPDGNGMDLISFMRANGRQTTPVMVFSATETPNELQNLVTASLVKSKTTNDELVKCIGRILNGNKLAATELCDK
jgi:DNA-binding response OmpR family regulator